MHGSTYYALIEMASCSSNVCDGLYPTEGSSVAPLRCPLQYREWGKSGTRLGEPASCSSLLFNCPVDWISDKLAGPSSVSWIW